MNKILKFSASWCGPCKMLANTIKKLPADKLARIEELDIDSCDPELVKKYGIRGVPTMVVLNKDGGVETTISGNVSLDKIERWL